MHDGVLEDVVELETVQPEGSVGVVRAAMSTHSKESVFGLTKSDRAINACYLLSSSPHKASNLYITPPTCLASKETLRHEAYVTRPQFRCLATAALLIPLNRIHRNTKQQMASQT